MNYDLKDYSRVFDVITKYEIEVIIHLGAQPIVNTAYRNPYETLESNIMGTVNVLEAARLYASLEAIVVASSDKAYGMSEVLPYTENMSLNGQHPYDCSKSCTDLIAKMYSKTYDLPVVISRFGNIFGPGDLNFNRIIPGIMKSLISGEELLLRSDGTLVREYLYVKDVADGYILLADNIDKVRGEAFNFGTSKHYSVLELIALCEEVLGQKVSYHIINNAKGEIQAQYLDCGKLKGVLNWECGSDLALSIKETFEWYKKYFA
ncbi:GDP-mannose 4,6-dehydratase [Candidatus Peregrinibacteria bacterium]|nr:GDP-mannose 4,6-dehydratase [Candidatus Peregrinibacteria bacterium]